MASIVGMSGSPVYKGIANYPDPRQGGLKSIQEMRAKAKDPEKLKPAEASGIGMNQINGSWGWIDEKEEYKRTGQNGPPKLLGLHVYL